MNNKSLMEELGFLITPNGSEIKFGKYKPYFLRDKENLDDFHNSSFKKDVLQCEEWLKLKIDLDDKFDITYNIAFLVSKGLIIGLNKTEGAYVPSTSTIVFAAPAECTEKQLEALARKKDILLEFDKDLSYVRIIDKEENTLERLQTMADFYQKYVIPQLEQLKTREK